MLLIIFKLSSVTHFCEIIGYQCRKLEYEKATVMRSSLTVGRIESHLKEEECYIYMDTLDKRIGRTEA